MPAHLRDLNYQCQSCARRASFEVLNTWNASMGYFCARHARQRVDQLNARETQP